MSARRRCVVAARALAYWQALRAQAGAARLLGVGMLVAGGAVLEGMGLMLLVPLLGVVTGSPPGYARWLGAHGVALSLPLWLLLFVALVGLRAALVRRRDIALLRLRIDFIDSLRNHLQSALALAQWRFLVRLDHAGALSAMLADLAAVNNGTYVLAQAVSALAVGAAGFVVAAMLAPGLAVSLLLLAALAALLLRGQLARAAALGAQAVAAQRNAVGAFTGFLSGLKQIKAGAMEQAHARRFAADNADLGRRQLAFFTAQANARAIFELGGAIVLAACVYLAYAWARMPGPELLLMALVLARLLLLCKALQGNARLLWHMLPAFAGVQRLTRRASRAAEAGAPAGSEPLPLRESLVFSGAGFRYGVDAWALRGIDLAFPAHGLIGLVGLSGAGKSTLADLACGLLAPMEGCVLLDGAPLEGERAARWRGSVGYVAQEPFLFADTVRANLAWSYPDAGEVRMWAALEDAAAAEFVRALPRGLDTHLGERGSRLSGGERQRIALARALLGEPALLVLDEFSSQLDAASEALVQQALARLRKRMLVLVIAHRLHSVRAADCIHVLAHGEIVQSGNWDSLAAQAGLFRELLRAGGAGLPR
jgi:ATP-binding cassette subfamily C protein